MKRRTVLGAFGAALGAPLADAAAKRVPKELLPPLTVDSGYQSVGLANPAPRPVTESPEIKAARALLRNSEMRSRRRFEAQQAPMDPDIAAMRSWSHGARIRAQVEKIESREGFFERLRNQIFGDHW